MDVAAKLPTEFLADVAVELDPRRASDVIAGMPAEQVAAVTRELTRRGFYSDKVDGKAGMLTRAALGAYQKANGLPLDCWPSQSLLDHMQK